MLPVNLILGIAGLILGIVSFVKLKENRRDKVIAVTGIILNVLGILFIPIAAIIGGFLFSAY